MIVTKNQKQNQMAPGLGGEGKMCATLEAALGKKR